MGIKLFSDTPKTSPVEYKKPDPNPYQFTITKIAHFTDFTVCKVFYPNCTTYNGYKILVYRRQDFLDVMRLGKLDPHFLENEISPIARFPAHTEGWKDAVSYATYKVTKETICDDFV